MSRVKKQHYVPQWHLKTFSQEGRSFEDSAFGGHRAFVVGNYLVFCVAGGEDIQIRRVLHGARRYEPLLRNPQL